MAFKSKDGRQFTNADSMRSHNAMHAGAPVPTMGEDGEEENPEQIALAHGPAHHVEIHHDHEMGVHEVHSDHPDGHHHHSVHGSAEEAHEHAHKLAHHGEAEHERDSEGSEGEEEEGGY